MCGQHRSQTVDIVLRGSSGRCTPQSDPHTTQLDPPLIAKSRNRSSLSEAPAGTGSTSAGLGGSAARMSAAWRANAAPNGICGTVALLDAPPRLSAAIRIVHAAPKFHFVRTHAVQNRSCRLVTACTSVIPAPGRGGGRSL